MIVCGIDEAGRGSFLGPMAIAGVAVDEKNLPKLKEAGVRDSKTLSPRTREILHDIILENSTFHVVRRVRPRTIDNSVVFHDLSDLEADRMSDIIRQIRAGAYYVDSCYADAKLFGSILAERSGNSHIHAYTKADSHYTIVAAASILAKVARDRSVARIRRHHPVGSGYPGDKKTAKYLDNMYRATGEFPAFVRRSWYTACRIAGDERLPV